MISHLVGWKKLTYLLIFDVKYDERRKAGYVSGGHLTESSKSLTYASVVNRDSFRLGFPIAALNGLKVLAGDIQNTYLNASTPAKRMTLLQVQNGNQTKDDLFKLYVSSMD